MFETILKFKLFPLLLCAFSLFAAEAECETSSSPNLLIIMTDEHNFRTLGCYRDQLSPEQALMWGPAVVDTPHIDSLAAKGAICTSFYATSPVCAPSRAAFVSGRYPQNTPVETNNIPLSDDIVTFAEILRRKDYATGYVGKWHLNGTGKPEWAVSRKFGFDDNRYMFNRGHWKQFKDTPDGPRVAATDKNGKPSYSVSGATKENFATDYLTGKTIDFIDAHKDKPFCVMLSLPDPHGPDTVRAPYDTMFDKQTYEKPASRNKSFDDLPFWGKKGQGNFKQNKYYGMVKCIDDNIGKIITFLRENKLLDNTIVVFTSDHGDLRGEHFKQNKGVPYEASARVPFIMSYPGKIKGGTVINEALTSVDFLPTVLNLMNIQTAGKEQGRDASALFLSEQKAAEWEDLAFMRSTFNGKADANIWLATLTDRYKLIFSSNKDPWLFDLKKNPNETVNQYTNPEYKATIRKLAEKLSNYALENNDHFIRNPNIKNGITQAIAE